MIVAEGVSKFYGAHRALSELSFRIETGEVVGFLGLNGAGKTTMLKILCGLLLPSAGRFTVDGIDGLEDPRALRRRIGFLPDRPPLYGEMSVRQMLGYAGRLNGVSAADIDRRVDEVLELANLGEVQNDLVEWLSHGFKQRVGIAQTIVHDPALVVLDEPISGLDPEQIVGMRALIRQLGEKHTVLLSSHILAEISQTCDRLLVLHQGSIVAQGSEGELTAGKTGGRLSLTVRGDREQTRATLEAATGASEVELLGFDDDVARFMVRVEDEDAREGVVKALVEAGAGVRKVADADGGGLEDVFLRLTRAPIADEGGDP